MEWLLCQGHNRILSAWECLEDHMMGGRVFRSCLVLLSNESLTKQNSKKHKLCWFTRTRYQFGYPQSNVNNLSDLSVRKEVISQHRNSTLNADKQDFLLIPFFKYFRQFRKRCHLVSLNGADSKLLHNVANRNHDYLEATIKIRISVLNTQESDKIQETHLT